jgi:hypothetical protein
MYKGIVLLIPKIRAVLRDKYMIDITKAAIKSMDIRYKEIFIM